MRERSRLLILVAALVVATPLDASRAAGEPTVVVTTLQQYLPGSPPYPETTVVQGQRLVLVNASVPGEQDAHDLVHLAPIPSFGSAVVEAGGTAPVDGVETLAGGRYPYFCTLHPTLMRGTLVVL